MSRDNVASPEIAPMRSLKERIEAIVPICGNCRHHRIDEHGGGRSVCEVVGQEQSERYKYATNHTCDAQDAIGLRGFLPDYFHLDAIIEDLEGSARGTREAALLSASQSTGTLPALLSVETPEKEDGFAGRPELRGYQHGGSTGITSCRLHPESPPLPVVETPEKEDARCVEPQPSISGPDLRGDECGASWTGNFGPTLHCSREKGHDGPHTETGDVLWKDEPITSTVAALQRRYRLDYAHAKQLQDDLAVGYHGTPSLSEAGTSTQSASATNSPVEEARQPSAEIDPLRAAVIERLCDCEATARFGHSSQTCWEHGVDLVDALISAVRADAAQEIEILKDELASKTRQEQWVFDAATGRTDIFGQPRAYRSAHHRKEQP